MAASDIFKADVADLLFRDVRNLSKSSGKTTADLLKVDVADILFRDVRHLTTPSGRGTRGKDAGKWFVGLEDADPEKAAHELAERLADALAREHDATKRLALLLSFEDAAEKVLPQLEQATAAAPLPLSSAAQQTAIATDSLLKATAIAYGRLAEGMDSAEQSSQHTQMTQQAALHAIRVLCRRQLLAYRACATPSAAAWKTMHDLYAMARRHGLAESGDDESTLEQEYITALLLAIADPAKMSRESMDTIFAFVARMAPFAQLLDAAAYKSEVETPAAFMLAPGRGRSGHGITAIPEDKALLPNSLALDCSKAIEALDLVIADKSGELPLPAEALRLMRDWWSGASAERKFPRTQFLPRADLVVAYKEILGLFSSSGRQNGSRQGAENPSAGDWSIVNESPDSFGIRHLGAKAPPKLEIGDLVVLLPREHLDQMCICLVRRISPGTEHFDVGLQQLCGQASVVNLPSEDISAFGQQVLLLPKLPGFGNASGVIAAAGALKPHTVISDKIDGAIKRFKLGSKVASSTAIEFHLLQAA